MSDIPKPAATARRTGLSPKEQKLQALRDKLAAQGASTSGAKLTSSGTPSSLKATKAGFKKTAFQRKAT